MAYNLTFTSTAGSDLDEILRYMSKELANPGAASAFLTRLEKVISEITDFPKCGKTVDNEFIPVADIRKLPVSNYMLYYRVDESECRVVVLRIIYGKRNPQTIINEI